MGYVNVEATTLLFFKYFVIALKLWKSLVQSDDLLFEFFLLIFHHYENDGLAEPIKFVDAYFIEQWLS